jgi:hypothetical protein
MRGTGATYKATPEVDELLTILMAYSGIYCCGLHLRTGASRAQGRFAESRLVVVTLRLVAATLIIIKRTELPRGLMQCQPQIGATARQLTWA